MNQSRTLLPAVVIAVAVIIGALGYFLGRKEAHEVPAMAPVTAPRAAQPDTSPSERQLQYQGSPNRETAQAEGQSGENARAPDQAAAPLVTAKVDEHDDRTLEQKYAGASIAQLAAAQYLLTEKRDRERERIGAEMVANARLERVAGRGDLGPHPQPSSPDGSPVSTVQVFEQVDGHSIEKAVTISGEEFPDYRALELEVWWLQCKIHTLNNSSQATGK